MITRFKKILFFADGARGELAALRRCHGIARRNGAELVVMGVVDEVSTNDVQLRASIKKIQDTLIRDRDLELDKLIAHLKPINGVIPKIRKVVVAGKDHVEVIREAVEGGFEVIVKSVNSKTAIQQAVFGSTDIRLMHYSPCPVLILKPLRRRSWRSVVVAVDPRSGSQQELDLNSDLMDMAVSAVEIAGAELHVLHVLERPLDGHTIKLKDEFKELEKSLKADAERKLQELTEGYGDVSLKEHLIKGKPHSVIAKFVDANEVDLLVMGSVARSGIPGFFVGNAAEKILNHIDCSVLVLKPRGWKTPEG